MRATGFLGTMARKFVGTGTYDYPEILTPLLQNSLTGLVLTTDTDTDHDINVGAGACRDSTNVATLSNTDITKQLDATWAAGDDAGGLNDTDHPVVQDTCYHVFLLGKPDGTTDAGFDTQSDGSQLLGDAAVGGEGYTLVRRIGAVRTKEAAANIIPFVQHGDFFTWTDPNSTTFATIDFTSATVGTTPQTATLKVPTGIRVMARVNVNCQTGSVYRLYPADSTDTAPHASNAPLSNVDAGSDHYNDVLTNTSGQIKVISTAANDRDFAMFTDGWFDLRGKDG
jgi:hypothetical protein